MSKRKMLRAALPALLLALVAGGCASTGAGNNSPSKQSESTGSAGTVVTITDNHGEIEVPVNPQRIVALDNTSLQTLSDWGVEVVAVPKGVMGVLWPEYTGNEEILDVGTHREPNLETVIAADPDLIIGGGRFTAFYDDLRQIHPTVIEIAPRADQDHVEELKRQTLTLGRVFDREADSEQLVEQLNTAVLAANEAYNPDETVLGLITSGGKLNYAAPNDGRGVGALFPALDLKPAIEQANENSSHGDEISVEAIAAANPDWLVVLDRDGAVSANEADYIPAAELIESSEALQNVTAVQKGQVIYLDRNFYLDEGIQAYTKLFNQVALAFEQAAQS